MLIRRLCLLAALCLLGSGAANAAVPVSVTSVYAIGLSQVAVKNLRSGQSQTCPFATQPTLVCQIQGVNAGDNLQLTVTPKSGFIVSGGTGLQCANAIAGVFQVVIPANGGTCGIIAGYPLTITSNAAGLVSVQTAGGSHCTLATLTCQLAVKPSSTITLTPGLAPNTTIAGGTGLCANASTAPFQVNIPLAPPFLCGITVKGVAPPSPVPQNGWWWANDINVLHFDSGTRYALQVNTAVNPKAMYGIVSTFRANGTPVWYLINAVLSNNSYQGTASEFSGGGGLTSKGSSPSSIKTVVANVQLTFSSPTVGLLTWSPRDGSAQVTKNLVRFPLGSTVQPPPAFAPVTGTYLLNPSPGGILVFPEMQGSGPPHAYMGFYDFDATGAATWSVSNTTGFPNPAPYPATGQQQGWTVKAQLMSYSGGVPVNVKPTKPPTTVMGSNISAVLGPGATVNTLTILPSTNYNLQFLPTGLWGQTTSPYWLQVVSQSPTIPNPYVTFFSAPKKPNFTYVPSTGPNKGQRIAFPNATSIQLSSITNGALLAPSQDVNGPLYFSSQPLQVGSTKANTCKPISSATPTQPSPLKSSDDCNLGTRWQFAELGGSYDVTYINVFSVPLAINQGSQSKGTASGTQFFNLMTTLAALGSNNINVVYPPNAVGANIIRVISPANASGPNDPLLTNFPSFASYIAKAFNSKGAPVTAINISNSYSGSTTAPDPTKTICPAAQAFAAQTYSTTSINYNSTTGALSIQGTGSTVGKFTLTGMVLNSTAASCQGSVGPLTCYTPNVSTTALSAYFYTAVLPYSVANPYCSASKVETNGANDVFSVVARDFLVGFASGFVNSTVPAPPSVSPPTIYGLMKSSQRSTDAAKLFTGVQPANPNFYNSWGSAIFTALTNTVYGFQYSDYFLDSGPLGNPLPALDPGVPVQIVIQSQSK
jgi:hypothetical protein